MNGLSESGPLSISGISKLAKEDREAFMAEFIRQTTNSETKKDMRAEMKSVIREAINDFLKEKYAEVGKWTIRGIAAAALSLLTYLILHAEGWRLIR